MTDTSRWGHFPFGQPNTERPMRTAQKTEVLVIGTYPSAWHVRWSAPSSVRRFCATGNVAAMAVDVEPTVFWNGDNSDFQDRLAKWCDRVGFRSGDLDGFDGITGKRSPATNGASGATIFERYLRALKITEDVVSFTDIFPVYMVKRKNTQKVKGREQGDAIRQEYDAIADRISRIPSSLPTRLQPEELPRHASHEFGSRLTGDILSCRPNLIISLGVEVWTALMDWPSIRAHSPIDQFSILQSDLYGSSGELIVAGLRISWLPLVHPGLLNRGSPWDSCHQQWESRCSI